MYIYLPVEFSLRSNACDAPTTEYKHTVVHRSLVMGGESGEGGEVGSGGFKGTFVDPHNIPAPSSKVKLERKTVVGTEV